MNSLLYDACSIIIIQAFISFWLEYSNSIMFNVPMHTIPQMKKNGGISAGPSWQINSRPENHYPSSEKRTVD